MKIAVGVMFQETASFSPLLTDRAAFEALAWHEGQVFLHAAPESTEIAGFLEACAGRSDITPIGTRAGAAWPCGPVVQAVYEDLRDGIVQGIKEAMPLDGVYLALHGSMVAEGCDDPEGELLAMVRGVVGPDLPVVATLDLHANVTQRMVDCATALVGYHCNPHTDMRETGLRAGRLLLRTLDGHAVPTMAWRKLPTIAPGNSQMTIFPCDYQNLYAFCAARETEPGVLACSNFAVHPFIDVPELGWAQVVVTDNDPALAQRLCDELSEQAWAMRGAGDEATSMSVTVEEAVAVVREADGGPIVIGDLGDTVNAGAAGDSPVLLRAFLEGDCGDLPIYLPLTDPAAVARLYDCATGEHVTLSLGATLAGMFFPPVEVTGTLLSKHEGRVAMESPTDAGVVFDRGRTVVFGAGGIRLVISERPSPGHDPAVFRSVGLEPADARAVVVKSMFRHMAVYGPMAHQCIWVNTPGPTHVDVRKLPYTRVTRPLFPLDHVATWR